MEKAINQNKYIKNSNLSSDIRINSIINPNTNNIQDWIWNTNKNQDFIDLNQWLNPSFKNIKKSRIRTKFTKTINKGSFFKLKNKYVSLKNIKKIFWLSWSRIDWWETNKKIKIYNFNWEKFLYLDKNWIEKIILSLTHWNTSWSIFFKFKNLKDSEIKNEFRKFLKLFFDIKTYFYSKNK